MSESHRKNLKNLELRARMPRIVRSAAVVILICALLVLVIGFYRAGNSREFRMRGFPTTLSKDVVARIENYERVETEGEIKKYLVRAANAVTFSDNHQELQDVYLEVFDESGQMSDKITAAKGVYVPQENKNFTAYFAGAVNIVTRDDLNVRTEQVTYRRDSGIAEAEEEVRFERGNISGRAIGAIVHTVEKNLRLMKNVEIDAFAADPQDPLAKSNIKSARITADSANFDQGAETIELTDNVFVYVIPSGESAAGTQPTEVRSGKAHVKLEDRQVRRIDLEGNVAVEQKPANGNPRWSKSRSEKATAAFDGDLKRIDLLGGVTIETGSADTRPTVITCSTAVYEKPADRFELHDSVHIVTTQQERETHIRSADAVYEQTAGRVALTGMAEIDNGQEYLKGDRVNATLFADRAIKDAQVIGAAYLRQTTAERTTEVSGDELNASFADDRKLKKADATGNSRAILVPAKTDEYSKVTMAAPRAIRLAFREAGILQQMTTDGRTTITINAPPGAPDAADKRITADVVKTFFHANGKDMQRAEAVGNAELYVEPLTASSDNYRTTVNAPRFDCEFFATGNNAKLCVGQAKTKTVRVPTVPADDRGVQTLTADKLTATFDQVSQDVEQLDAIGSAKFVELDRNGTAAQMSFVAKQKLVKLRGGEPMVWDSKARAKAVEIDWDTGKKRSYLRGTVSTTYYNQKQTGGATPFGESNKPVFLTASSAEIDHAAETATYSGNARAWQDDNYVRAERIVIKQREQEFQASGKVQSVIYDARSSDRKNVPVFAAAQQMSYARATRILRYEDSVDIRQATDRVTGGIAVIQLDEKNDMSQTTIENNVVITQPKRRATGTWAQYTNDSDVAILRGNPAVVEDAENGSTQGAQLTMFRRENRVVTESKTSPNSAGRIRSVYKVKKNQE
ncbi:MAG TPA: LPS export ABC transporter periplasmic protein LptC [Pyrinomonadaceae bacterium]|nr:LPS export ABC transporter periplasmic protein LptC [Pyrinomonadaceae bacterium]